MTDLTPAQKQAQQKHMDEHMEKLKLLFTGEPQKALFKRIEDQWGRDAIPKIPSYKEGTTGDWSIEQSPMPLVRGYYTELSSSTENYVLRKGPDREVWMSLTPMELESHLVPKADAEGKVIVAGLGLGLITVNLLNDPYVGEVVVLEQCQDLIDDLGGMLTGAAKEIWDENLETGRLTLLQCDIKKPLSREVKDACFCSDVLYVDTWSSLFADEAIPTTDQLHDKIDVAAVVFWGQELEILSKFQELNDAKGEERRITEMDDEEWHDFINEQFPFPMTVSNYTGEKLALYLELCEMAAMNVANY